jgi:hypothetical protein
MPNHCTNLLSCTSGKSIGSIIKPYLTDDGKSIDFKKILPHPECIEASCKFGDIEFITQKRTAEEQAVVDAERKVIENICLETTGHKSWYDWNVANWDTKWNAYNCYTLEEDSFNELDEIYDIGFQTAWSPPINVIRELAKLTGESLRMSYYDEGWMFGGEYLVNADGSETDNCYDDIDNCPDHLKEELDVQYFLDCRAEDEDDEDEE